MTVHQAYVKLERVNIVSILLFRMFSCQTPSTFISIYSCIYSNLCYIGYSFLSDLDDVNIRVALIQITVYPHTHE